MKKLSALICALILLCVFSCAAEIADNTASVNFQGEALTLNFDSTPTYSYRADGLYHVSFYAFTPQMDKLYELCIEFPDTVTAGTVLTETSEPDSGILFVYSTYDSVLYYAASRYQGSVEPAESSYSISFTQAENGVFAGTIDAMLLGVAENDYTWNGETFSLNGAEFRFSMSGTEAQPAIPDMPPQTEPETPSATPEPQPVIPFTAVTPAPEKDLIRC